MLGIYGALKGWIDMTKMLVWLDRAAALLLALLSAGHGILGSLMSFPLNEQSTVWHFSGSIAAWMIAAINWLRSGRPGDKVLAFWALIGALAYAVLMAWFMQVTAMWSDPRPLMFFAASLVLAAFSLAGLVRRPVAGERPQA
jgi:hypothetical protein